MEGIDIVNKSRDVAQILKGCSTPDVKKILALVDLIVNAGSQFIDPNADIEPHEQNMKTYY